MTSKPTKVIEVFISYAHKDERLMKDEQASLTAQELENKGAVSHDRDEEQFDGTDELTESLRLEEKLKAIASNFQRNYQHLPCQRQRMGFQSMRDEQRSQSMDRTSYS